MPDTPEIITQLCDGDLAAKDKNAAYLRELLHVCEVEKGYEDWRGMNAKED